jgi:hypothetical protein
MHCWIFRHEALGFPDAWWQAPVPDDLDCAEWGCDLSPGGGAWDHNCVDGYLKAMCGLRDGHPGDHEFVKSSQITLTFAEEAPHVVV